MESLRPNEQRAKNAVLLIWIVLAMDIISITSDFFQYKLIYAAGQGELPTEAAAASNDSRQQIIGIVYIIASILSCITFIQWFRRGYFNLHQRVNSLSYSEGWAAGGWFVPIISLYYPYRIMKEMWRETDYIISKNNSTYRSNTNISIVGWWWTLWIIVEFVGRFVAKYSLRADTIDELLTSTLSSMVQSVISIALGLVTIKIVKEYSQMETQLAQIPFETNTPQLS